MNETVESLRATFGADLPVVHRYLDRGHARDQGGLDQFGVQINGPLANHAWALISSMEEHGLIRGIGASRVGTVAHLTVPATHEDWEFELTGKGRQALQALREAGVPMAASIPSHWDTPSKAARGNVEAPNSTTLLATKVELPIVPKST